MEILNTSNYYVYILANTTRDAFFIDTTSDLNERIRDLSQLKPTADSCHHLLYWESFDDVMKAIKREDQIKRFSVSKLLRLIRVKNPDMDLMTRSGY